MATIPSVRFSKANWLNFHRHHCSSLITKRFKKRTRFDSSWVKQIPNCLEKYLGPLKTLNCGIGGDSIQSILWRAQNLSSLKKVIFSGTNNLFQDSPEEVADAIT